MYMNEICQKHKLECVKVSPLKTAMVGDGFAIMIAMTDLMTKETGRYFGTYGNWELGINTETGVVYHAKMLR